MDLYEINSKGLFFIEKISSLPIWTSAYEGRIVYDENTNKFYVGDNTKWNEGGGGDWNFLTNKPTNLSDINSTEGSKLAGIANNANNYSHPNHTGDIISNSDGPTVIGNDKGTNAKLANMPANTLKGRQSTTGNPQDLTVAQAQAMLGSGGDDGHSFGLNGYQKFTWGLIIQWGLSVALSPDSGAWVTFPIVFPHACLQVVACHDRDYNGVNFRPDDGILAGSLATNRFRIGNADEGGPSRGRYVAYGY